MDMPSCYVCGKEFGWHESWKAQSDIGPFWHAECAPKAKPPRTLGEIRCQFRGHNLPYRQEPSETLSCHRCSFTEGPLTSMEAVSLTMGQAASRAIEEAILKSLEEDED